ncbi:arginine--tRNA ligase [Pelagibacteraceae bacterium]|jgi:arginyl-tRNA synthetase|nr:arginine--tRNA ligase [Pelagibacteraceae bacterium]
MSQIYSHIKEIISNSASISLNLDRKTLDEIDFSVEKPNEEKNGEISSNISLIIQKLVRENPIDIANKIVLELKKCSEFIKVDVAKPGFINLWLDSSMWQNYLKNSLELDDLIDCNIGNGRTVNVEYVSANPTGPLHIGHCRGAVFGDVLSNLLQKTGHQVTKEYYINDAGSQIKNLTNSVFIRYQELIGKKFSEYPDDFYPGDYLVPVAQHFASTYNSKLLEMNDEERFLLIKPFTINFMMNLIKEDLAAISIYQDIFISEQDLVSNGKIDEAIKALKKSNLIYEGVLEPPKGKKPDDWEPRPQMLFKSTKYGDEVDRPLQKSNKEWTYFANDIAYHFDKYQRGSNHLVDILGADHGGYVKRMTAAVAALSDNKASFTAKLCQMVKLTRNGKQIKMSKRSGEFITLREVIDEVGSDSIRFMMLYRKNEAPLEFDFTKVTEQSKDNPVFYVQYAHARISSVISKLNENNFSHMPSNFENIDFTLIDNKHELDLVKKIADWNKTIESATNLHEPHRIAYYLYELSSVFHSLWSQGKIDPNLKFIIPNNETLTFARIGLLTLTQRTIKSGLDLLGVSSPREMK